MAKYRVLEGTHVDGRIVYQKGDVSETEHDLVKLFPGKFQRVADEVPATVAKKLPVPPVRTEQEPPQAPEGEQGGATAADTPAVAPKKGKAGKQAKATAPAGIDVTARFPKAVDQDFKVYKSEGQYFIYNADNMAAPVNAEGVNKNGVDAVIDGALDEGK